uniref:Protein XRI1 n=1 Tax=Globodera pallida TaxID=36090 RepID=A0A183BL16_GLOPA
MRKKSFCRHFLVLTFANGSQFDHCQPSPFERNWQQTPLNFGDEKCFGHGFSDCNLLNLRRWKSVRISAIDAHSDLTLHKFVDLSFFDLMFSSKEVPLDFLDTNQNGEFWQLDSFEKGLYEELRTVKWEGLTPEESDHWMSDSSDQPANGRDEGSSSSIWGEYSTTTGEENAEDRDTDNSDDHSDLTLHKFVDLSFFDVMFSSKEVPSDFLDINQNGEFWQLDSFEKGLYEELKTVKWEGLTPEESDHWMSDSSDQPADCKDEGSSSSIWGEYSTTAGEENAEDRDTDNSGYILVGHPSGSQQQPTLPFVSDWNNWSSVRNLCATLPQKCTFRRLSFYRKRNGKCRYEFIVLIQVDNVTSFVDQISNCLNKAQSIPEKRAYIDLYQEIEFEVDLEVLQHLVEISKSINCVGRRLVVQFGDDHSTDTFSLTKQAMKKSLKRANLTEQDLTNNNNNGGGGGMGILWKNDRKNSRKMVKNLFTISTSYPQQPAELLQLVEGHHNNEKMAGQDVKVSLLFCEDFIRKCFCGSGDFCCFFVVAIALCGIPSLFAASDGPFHSLLGLFRPHPFCALFPPPSLPDILRRPN